MYEDSQDEGLFYFKSKNPPKDFQPIPVDKNHILYENGLNFSDLEIRKFFYTDDREEIDYKNKKVILEILALGYSEYNPDTYISEPFNLVFKDKRKVLVSEEFLKYSLGEA